jgi:hypothetical protein
LQRLSTKRVYRRHPIDVCDAQLVAAIDPDRVATAVPLSDSSGILSAMSSSASSTASSTASAPASK